VKKGLQHSLAKKTQNSGGLSKKKRKIRHLKKKKGGITGQPSRREAIA